MGLLKKARKVLEKGSNASTASSAASSVAVNAGSGSVVKLREFLSSSIGVVYMPELPSPPNPSTFFAQYPTGSGRGRTMRDPAAQMSFSFDGGDGVAFDMDEVQGTLPPSPSWPHSTPNPGGSDSLVHMEMFNEQFWEEGLVSFFFLTPLLASD
jgi:hypothetical protein